MGHKMINKIGKKTFWQHFGFWMNYQTIFPINYSNKTNLKSKNQSLVTEVTTHQHMQTVTRGPKQLQLCFKVPQVKKFGSQRLQQKPHLLAPFALLLLRFKIYFINVYVVFVLGKVTVGNPDISMDQGAAVSVEQPSGFFKDRQVVIFQKSKCLTPSKQSWSCAN